MTAKDFTKMTEDELDEFLKPHFGAPERGDLPPDFEITCPFAPIIPTGRAPAIPNSIGWSASDGAGKVIGNYLLLTEDDWSGEPDRNSKPYLKVVELLEINARQSWYRRTHPDYAAARAARDALWDNAA